MAARSLFAALAAAYFLFAALAFMAPDAAEVNTVSDDGITTSTEIVGESGAVAVTIGVRTLAGGLALVSLALVEWGAIAQRLREADAKAAAGR